MTRWKIGLNGEEKKRSGGKVTGVGNQGDQEKGSQSKQWGHEAGTAEEELGFPFPMSVCGSLFFIVNRFTVITI